MASSRALPKAVISLFVFYSAVGLIGFFLLTPGQFTDWLHSHGIEMKVNVVQLLPFQLKTIQVQVIDAGFWLAIGIAAGLLISGILVMLIRKERNERAFGKKGMYRGISITLGDVPTPAVLPRNTNVKFKMPKPFDKQEDHCNLGLGLAQILAFKPDAYAGDGHGVGLYQHHLNVLKNATDIVDSDDLLGLAAMAHDIGKLLSFHKVGSKWVVRGKHDLLSAKILTALPEWDALEDEDKYVLALAIRFSHSSKDIPYSHPVLNQLGIERANKLVGQLKQIDNQVTSEEKEVVLEGKQEERPDLVMDSFLASFYEAPFQIPSLGPGINTVGWRYGENRVFFLENALRTEYFEKNIDSDVWAAYGGDKRNHGKLHGFTEALFNELNARGWLVNEARGEVDDFGMVSQWKLNPKMPLWDIVAGTRPFKSVFIVDFPDDMIRDLPDSTAYKIAILGPANKKYQISHKEVMVKKLPPKKKEEQPPIPNLEDMPPLPEEDHVECFTVPSSGIESENPMPDINRLPDGQNSDVRNPVEADAKPSMAMDDPPWAVDESGAGATTNLSEKGAHNIMDELVVATTQAASKKKDAPKRKSPPKKKRRSSINPSDDFGGGYKWPGG